MKKITLKVIKKWFKDENLEPRHDLKGLKYAINESNKEFEVDALDLFLLLVSNTPIDELYTHSYGFHTRNGRYVINTIQNHYHGYNQI